MRRKLIIFSLTATALALTIVALSMPTRADTGLASLNSRLGLIPQDASFVLSVDFEALRRSELYDKYARDKENELEAQHAPFRELIQETGLDPKKDVDSLLLGTRAASGKSPFAVVGIVLGRFDPERIGAVLKKEGAKTVKVGGHTLYLPKKPEEAGAEPCGDFAITFLGPQAIGFGTQASVKDLVANIGGGPNGFLASSENRDLVASLDTHAQVFGIVRSRDIADKLQGALAQDGVPPALRTLKTVQTMTFALNLSDSVDVSARATCGKPEDAVLVHDAIKGMLAMAKLASQEDAADLASAIDLAQIQNDGTAVTFSIKVPGDVIDHWHDKLERLHEHRTAEPKPQAI